MLLRCPRSPSCVLRFVIPQTAACQAPLCMRFSQQEYWSGLPWPPPDDLPDPVIEPVFLHLLYCRQTPPLSNSGSPVRALAGLKTPLEWPSVFNSSLMNLNNKHSLLQGANHTIKITITPFKWTSHIDDKPLQIEARDQ